eukprot:scpid96737/ scgid20669/ 
MYPHTPGCRSWCPHTPGHCSSVASHTGTLFKCSLTRRTLCMSSQVATGGGGGGGDLAGTFRCSQANGFEHAIVSAGKMLPRMTQGTVHVCHHTQGTECLVMCSPTSEHCSCVAS